MTATARKCRRRRSAANRLRCVHHEAGHALVAELVGADVCELDIFIDRPAHRWGKCIHMPASDQRDKLLILMAGYAGEVVGAIAQGINFPPANLIGRDVKAAEKIATDWLGPRNTKWRRQRIYAGAAIRAVRLLQKHYPAFDAVANCVARKRKLDGKTVRNALAMFRIIPPERGSK